MPTAAESEISALLAAGRHDDAVAATQAALADTPSSAPLLNLLAAARLMTGDAVGAIDAARQGLEIDPTARDIAQNLAAAREVLRIRYREALASLGDLANEAERLEAAYHAVAAAHDAGVLEPDAEGVALGVFLRLAAHEEADRRWPFAEVGPRLAERGDHASLIQQLPRVKTDEDRRELLAQHRAWGRAAEVRAAADPIRPAARGPRSKVRVAIVSSDLRNHGVGALTDPLVGHAAEAGVEVFCYSAHPGAPDRAQQHYAARVAKFFHAPGAGARELAQAIAGDAPDVLVEIGGSTNANRLEAMAHRLAPRQISWLGYPQSTGLSTIDEILLDPHLLPSAPDLLLERPRLLPATWLSLSQAYFHDGQPLNATLPEVRSGKITFGSAGSPYKYTPETLDAWARVLAAVPGSRLLIVRPETGSGVFRANILAHFARVGVASDRLVVAPIRAGHMRVYGDIDIALDTFPLTGGMTTCEALWSGVPVVSLAGRSVFERLSHSLLTNAGLGDLSTATTDAFVARAVALAGDREARVAWRTACRPRLRASPLGDTRAFALDFWRTVTTA
jgi:protein O-GlcNAc transferase